MRQKIKSLGIAFMMILAMLAMTACSSGTEGAEEDVAAEIVESLSATQDNLLAALSMLTDEDIASFMESGDAFTVSAMQAWNDNKDELGAYVELKDVEVVLEDDLYLVTGDAAFELADATVIMNVDAAGGSPTYFSMEVQYSFGELMKQAGLNTLMGVGIVFLVLLLLTFLISLFKYIGKIGNKPGKVQEASKVAPAVVSVPAEEEELADDAELVAVIAAAIAASENTSTDSFVVRSIRRKPNNKWHRA